MSDVEYVVNFGSDKSIQFVKLSMAEVEHHGARLGEKIVRCKDCAYSRIHDGTRFPKDEIYKGATYCIAWSDGYQGEWTKPDGFCHKAKRKVDA